MQHLDPNPTTWHISFGTYGARLHGGPRPTVERNRNRRGDEFVAADSAREQGERGAMRGSPVFLTVEQQRFVQDQIPDICRRGGWALRTCAAGPDHVHVLCDVPKAIHGEKVRRLIKRWLGQAMSERWTRGTAPTWWAE